MIKRVILFILTNILVMLTISVVIHLFGVDRYVSRYGLDYRQLAIFCLIWGMSGSFISLAISRFMAKRMMGVQVIDPTQANADERWLLNTVHRLAERNGITTMPEVGIYQSPEVNAFATGPSRNKALVAVSSGIMQRMDRDQLEGVLGHEMSHVSNGDMVTMTLLQGIINAFVMFLARVIAFAISQGGRRDEREERGGFGGGSYFLVFILEMVFGALGSLVIMAFSRYREFRADYGGARLVGKSKMIGALRALQATVQIQDPAAAKPALAAFKISGQRRSLFSSHPSLDDRIARLEAAQIIQ